MASSTQMQQREENLRSETGTSMRDARDRVVEKAEGLGTEVRAAARAAKDTAIESADHYRERAVSQLESLEACVMEKPIQSLMIAAGAGLVAGMILARR